LLLTNSGVKNYIQNVRAVTLTHHTHAAETTLPLITAAATQRRSRSARDDHA